MPTVRTSDELYVHETTTFAADFIYEFTSPGYPYGVAIYFGEQNGGPNTIAPSLYNYGSLSAYDSTTGPMGGRAVLLSIGESSFWRGSWIENHGTMRATSLYHDATAIASSSWCPSIINTGQIIVEGRTSAVAISVWPVNNDQLPFSFFNSGMVSAVGNQATTFSFTQGDVVNEGTMRATGGAGETFTLITTRSTILNSGSIIAEDNAFGASAVAIAFTMIGNNALRNNDVSNSGLISGEIAIAELVEANSQTRVSNSGEIRGDIDLRSGEDVVRNTGLIAGEIRLGSGADLYDGRLGGRVTGLVDGGADADTALFSGPRGSWSITLLNGVTTLQPVGGGDAVRLTGFERIRFDDGLYDAAGAPMQNLAINGTTAGDTLRGTGDTDTINGMNGDDTLVGGVGDDILDGGAGLDVAVFSGRYRDYTISIDGGTTTVTGRDGVDTLVNVEAQAFQDFYVRWGGTGNDVLWGTSGADIINGMAGDDVMDGIWGQDTLNGGDGDDTFAFAYNDVYGALRGAINGDAGLDTIDLTGNPNTRITPLDDGSFLLSIGAQDYAVSSVERVVGRTGDHPWRQDDLFDLTGYDHAVELTGNGGDDRLLGGDGDDMLSGGEGNDALTGGFGHDRIDGGAGDDVLNVSGDFSAYRVLLDGEDFILKGPDGGDRLIGVESISFGDGRVLELNRMYGPGVDGGAWTDGRIPESLLSGGEKGRDLPLVLPGVEEAGVWRGKGSDGSQVLPGVKEPSLFAGLEARLGPVGGAMLTLDIGLTPSTARPDDWM